MLWEISLLVIAIAFLLLCLFALPMLLQVRRTAKSFELTSKALNQNLPGILTNLDEITTHMTQTTQSIHDQIDGLKGVVGKFHDIADDVVDFERNIRAEIEAPLMETVTTLTATIKAVRAFVDAWRSK